MSSLTIPSPFVEARPGLRQLGLSGRRAASGLRRSARARTATSRSSPARRATTTSPGRQPLLGTYNTSALVYRGHYYTLLDRGFLLCHDARTGTADLRTQAHLRRVERLHDARRGPTTGRSSC